MVAVFEGIAPGGEKGVTVTSGSSRRAIVSESAVMPAITAFLVAE